MQATHVKEISRETFKTVALDMSLKITNFIIEMYFPGANDLTQITHLKRDENQSEKNSYHQK